jgi:serine/threonine protein kinase
MEVVNINKYIPFRTIREIFGQILRGVWFLASKGYSHNDLKLENILLD